MTRSFKKKGTERVHVCIHISISSFSFFFLAFCFSLASLRF